MQEIISTEYSEVMQKSYIDYAMSVICARAVPDVRDGLKPVQRRVLYAMAQLGLRSDKPHRKSARIVGDTMGKYHPHGDSSIYETLVVLEQEFKKGMPLVDGHGNFGSIEGDGAAAMRYTEARLQKFTQDVYLADLDKNVVDFIPNFDETEKEPEVLPVRIPNILVNGAEGIAVGMTTSIPTHNLSEVIAAMILAIKKPKVTAQELMEVMPGPDFPTGGIVINKSELAEIYKTGMGKIKLRGKVILESGKRKADRDKLVITEIPYTMIGANIGKFLADICALVENRKLPEVVDVSNESDAGGIRIVLELKKGADPERVKNILYKKTKLEDTFGVNMLAICAGRPEVLGLSGILKHSIDFQYEINTRKYTTLLLSAQKEREVKEGLIRATDIIDLIIEIIRGSKTIAQAKACLMEGAVKDISFKSEASKKAAAGLNFTEVQADAILALRLSKLIGLEILKLKEEYDELLRKIAEYEKILGDKSAMRKVIIKDLERILKEYGYARRTVITDEAEAAIEEEVIEEQEVVFLMDRFGYAKTIDSALYDKNAAALDSENKYVIRCLNTDKLCIFTDTGLLHIADVLKIPLKKAKDKGTPIDNLCGFSSDSENIVAVYVLRSMLLGELLFTTKFGMMKFVNASEFDVSRKNIAATKLSDGDELIGVDFFDASNIKVYGGMDLEEDEDFGGVLLSGGSYDENMFEGGSNSDGESSGEAAALADSPSDGAFDSLYYDDDDQLMFEFIDLGDRVDENPSVGNADTSPWQGRQTPPPADADTSPWQGRQTPPPADADTSPWQGRQTPPSADADTSPWQGRQTPPSADEADSTPAAATVFSTTKMAVLQTKDGYFIRFKLNEVPEKKKNAVGVRGIKLREGDEVEKIYVIGFGEGATASYRGKDIELIKVKLSARAGKGTKLRV